MQNPIFSDRYAQPSSRNALSRLLENKRTQAAEVLDLTESNPTRAGFHYPEAQILSAISQHGALRYDPDPRGPVQAREAIAGYYGERGHVIAVDDIFLTAGSSEGYAWLFKLLANAEDVFAVPEPSYPLFDFLARSENVQLVPYPLRHHGSWLLDTEELASVLEPRCRAVLVVHPNNPTGSYLKARDWQTIQDVCRRKGLPLICDEVFFDYAFPGVVPPDLVEDETVLTFSLNGLSKTVALPQLKLGWILLRGPENLKAAARERLEIISDTFLSVGTPVALATPRILGIRTLVQKQILTRLISNYDFLRSALRDTACQALDVEGGWYAVVRVPRTRSEEEWVLSLLESQNLLVHPGYFYNFSQEAYLILSLLCREDVFQRGVEALCEGVRKGA